MILRLSMLSPSFAVLAGRSFQEFGDALRTIEGVRDPVEIHAGGTLSSGIGLYVLDGATVPAGEVSNRFRYRLNPLLMERIAGAGERAPRPLIDANFRGLNDDLLYLDLLQTHRDFYGRGLGGAFYRSLQAAARTFGYRFIGQRHISREATEFFLRRGCVRVDEASQTFRAQFEAMYEEDPPVPGWEGIYTLFAL